MDSFGCLQIRAIFLKQWYQVKRQKCALCCLGTSPLFVLLLIYLLNYLLKEINMLALKKVDELPLLPFYIYPMNLMRSPAVTAALPSKTRASNGKLIHQFGYSSEAAGNCGGDCQADIEDMLDYPPLLFSYGWNGTRQPQFYKSALKTVRDANLEIAKGIEVMQKTPIRQLWWDNDLPDSFIMFNSANNSGVSAHMQVNNLVRRQYHRENGFAFMRTFTERDVGVGSKGMQTVPTIVATEGYTALMNLFSNMFLQKLTDTQGSLPKIIGIISPTADSNIVLTVADTFYGIICTNAVPVALSLGFPIMLATLVSDKEQRVASLFRVNGLREKNHWFGFYSFYVILLSISSTTFWSLGKRYVDISFFIKTDSVIMISIFTFWNLAQTSQALLAAKLINTSGTAMTVGYIFAIMTAFFLSGMSLFMFQAPNYMPWYFYLAPQTAFIRFMYVMFVDAAEHRFLTSLTKLDGEALLCFILLPVLAAAYGIIGIKSEEWCDWLEQILIPRIKHRYNRWKTVPGAVPTPQEHNNIYTSIEMVRDYEQLEPGAIVEIGTPGADTSVKQYTEEKLQLDPQHPMFPLVAQHVSHQFENPNGSKFYALKDVTLALKRGSITGLLGPNGAGKSTFISVVTRLLNPTEGTVYLRGQNVQHSPRAIQGIGYCPQSDIVIGELTVWEHLQVFHRLKGLSTDTKDRDIGQLLRKVELWEHKDKPANALSGGMKRRLSLAICLIGDPEVVYLDEPTNGLDPVLRKAFWVLLQSLLQQKAVLLTTHLLTEVEALCNEVAVLVEGQLRVIGHPGIVKKKFSGGPRIQLIFKSDSTPAQIVQLTEEIKDIFSNSAVTPSNINPKVFYVQGKLTVGLQPTFDLKTSFGWLSDKASHPTSGLDAWSISLGGLEDAFLNIVDMYSTKHEMPLMPQRTDIKEENIGRRLEDQALEMSFNSQL